MRYTIIIMILFLWFMLPQAEATEFPGSAGGSEMPRTPADPENGYTPFSSGNNRPPLRIVDPNDDEDIIKETDGDDGDGNQNDNGVPVRDGMWIMLSIAWAYILVTAIRKRKVHGNANNKTGK
jgi:hypothetical protein